MVDRCPARARVCVSRTMTEEAAAHEPSGPTAIIRTACARRRGACSEAGIEPIGVGVSVRGWAPT